MGITLVARGRDHLGNTPHQILLYRGLGWEPPEFAHLPMMLSPKGEKLSKRHAAVSVSEYRELGYTPMGVNNYLVRFGWSHGDQEIFSRQQLIELFSWDEVGRADGKFDDKKFADVAFEHLKEPALASLEEYATWVRPFLAKRGLGDVDEGRLSAAIPTIRARSRTLVDAARDLDFYFREPPELDPQAQQKFLTAQSADLLDELGRVVSAAPAWDPAALEEAVRVWTERSGIKMKDVAQPARVALTGRTASPPLFDVMGVLGKDRSLARLARGSELAKSG
jgi:glutamyl-tRNA synthetase